MSEFKPTEREVRVLKMAAGKTPWEHGSWVNACVEFLQEAGFLNLKSEITERGYKYVESLDGA